MLLAGGHGQCIYIEINEEGEVQEVGKSTMASEVACIDITPIGKHKIQ